MTAGFKLLILLPVLWWLGALAPAVAQEAPAPPEEPTDLSLEPVTFTNETQDFRVIFPSGCGKLVARSNEPDYWAGETWDDIIRVTTVYCDRYQVEGEGCSLNATFNLPGDDGPMAGPAQVIELVEEVLQAFSAKIVNQHIIKKEFDNGTRAEGVELFARDEMGKGEVWIRGLLVEGDIYVLTAWNEEGGLWNHPDYKAFFNSFQPWVD
jgi:hypothetical protein